MKRIVLVCLFIFSGVAIANNKPKGVFLSDSVSVGTPVQYSLSMRYPLEWQVIFPDTNYNYQPFELLEIEYFPTISDSENSFDSAVYMLISFSLDSIQSLSLPVFIIRGKDSLSMPAEPKALPFKDIIPVVSDTLSIKENTETAFLTTVFNYPRLFWGLGIATAILLVVIVFFGKRILVQWKVYLLGKRNKKFIEQIDKYTSSQDPPDKPTVESLEKLWKSYLETVSIHPYSALTTKEISSIDGHIDIVPILKSFDNYIYGDRSLEKWVDKVVDLKNFAIDQYFSHLEGLKTKKG